MTLLAKCFKEGFVLCENNILGLPGYLLRPGGPGIPERPDHLNEIINFRSPNIMLILDSNGEEKEHFHNMEEYVKSCHGIESKGGV